MNRVLDWIAREWMRWRGHLCFFFAGLMFCVMVGRYAQKGVCYEFVLDAACVAYFLYLGARFYLRP